MAIAAVSAKQLASLFHLSDHPVAFLAVQGFRCRVSGAAFSLRVQVFCVMKIFHCCASAHEQ